MHAFSRWLETTALSQALQQEIWLIELLQIVHILSVAVVLSSVLMLGLRIAGVRSMRDQTLAETARRFMPWFRTALALLAASGLVLIISEPKRTLDGNPVFQTKLLMIVLAIAAALAFQVSLKRRATLWEEGSRRRALRGTLAVAGMVLVCAIVIAGRWIAYAGAD